MSGLQFFILSFGDWIREHGWQSRPSPVFKQLCRAVSEERFFAVLYHSHQLFNEPVSVPLGVGPEGPTERVTQLSVQLLVENVD